ncbi:hypothetical protein F5887DRAFT_912470 [Amanita rubescens]|nr:hypothetical protein F5887DRAFT_912470 [Amanita rubescens]
MDLAASRVSEEHVVMGEGLLGKDIRVAGFSLGLGIVNCELKNDGRHLNEFKKRMAKKLKETVKDYLCTPSEVTRLMYNLLDLRKSRRRQFVNSWANRIDTQVLLQRITSRNFGMWVGSDHQVPMLGPYIDVPCLVRAAFL